MSSDGNNGRGIMSRPCRYSYYPSDKNMQMAAGYEEKLFQDVCVSLIGRCTNIFG